MDIYFNYCSDDCTGECASIVKCNRDSFESGFIKAVNIDVNDLGSTLMTFDSAQDVFNALISYIDFYWGGLDNLADDEFIEAVNNILNENPDIFDVCDFIVDDEPGDITEDMVVIGGDTL